MRILITGYTTRMYGSQRLRHDYVTFTFLLEDMLKALGHQVERRQVSINEEITYVYDYAFCGVAPLSSISAAAVPQTHYVMDCLPGRHAVFADDWSFCGFGNSVRYTIERWDKYLKYKSFNLDDYTMEATRNSLNLMVKMQQPGNNAPVLVPMFPWGDHDFLMRDNYNARLVTVDPSAWVKYPTIEICNDLESKKKQWVMAALSNHTRWVSKQGFTLPVKYVGNAGIGEVLSENDTIQLFADSYGVLSCKYPSAGSGWWRTRYQNAAWADTLVYCDPLDQAIMGDPYRGSVQEFELMNEKAYWGRVSDQRIWLEDNVMTKEESLEIIRDLIKK